MKKTFLASALTVLFVASPVFAQGYVGFGLGSASLSNVDATAGGVGLTGGNAAKTSIKILGGYQITPVWGVELQYTDLGKRNITATPNVGINTNSIQASQFGLVGTGTLPIATNFSAFGKLGVTANRAKTTDSSGASASEKATGLTFGLGVNYKLSPALAIRAEFEDFGKFSKNGAINGGAIKGNNFGLGLLYTF